MRKIKRKKNGQFKAAFKNVVKRFLKRVLILISLAIGGMCVYAYASYQTAQATQAELKRLKREVLKYQNESQDKNKGVIKTIENVCEEEGFDAELAVKIAACESYLQPYFVKVNRNGSIDRGLFAFNSQYYKEVPNECAFSAECSTRMFVKEAKEGRIKNWICYKKVK